MLQYDLMNVSQHTRLVGQQTRAHAFQIAEIDAARGRVPARKQLVAATQQLVHGEKGRWVVTMRFTRDINEKGSNNMVFFKIDPHIRVKVSSV